MSILVVAEHDNSTLNPVTLNVIAAAGARSGCESWLGRRAGG